jgi:hypothetical protein
LAGPPVWTFTVKGAVFVWERERTIT